MTIQFWDEADRSVVRLPLNADSRSEIEVDCDSRELVIRYGASERIVHRLSLDPKSMPTRLEATRGLDYFEVVVPKASTLPKFPASHVSFVSNYAASAA